MANQINHKLNDCLAKEVAMFEYKVICAWCQTLMEIKTSSDPKMQGQESHSICLSCQEKINA